jgi:hypothetical protein
MKNLNALGFLADVVEDAVGAKDDLAQGSSRTARIGGANKGKGLKNSNVAKYAPPEPEGGLRVILGDVGASFLEVRNRRV